MKTHLNTGLIITLILTLNTSISHAQKAHANTVEKPVTSSLNAEKVTKIPDFASIRHIPYKKKAFFDFMRPIIESENAKILALRNQLSDIRKRITSHSKTTPADLQLVSQTAASYRVKDPDINNPAFWNLLLERVDAIPFRLVLSQSANESSWGTSRFAREGHNFFGQWCFSKGCGIIPSRRSAGMKHEVAVFDSVNTSVAAYLKNLNTGRVYKPLRRIRAEMHAKNMKITAHALAAGLIKYSERREAYVKEIRSMIRVNYKLMAG